MAMLVFAICLTICCHAQTSLATDNYHFSLGIEPAITLSRVVDKAFSSLPFTGSIPGGAISFGYHGNKATHHLDLSFSSGTLSMEDHDQFSLNQKTAQVNYSNWYHLIINEGPLHFQLGASLLFRYDHHKSYQFSNHNITYQWISTAALSARVSYFFGASQNKWSIVEQPDFGVLSANSESDPGGDESKQNSSWKFSPVFSLHRLKNSLDIGKEINERSRISISYVWDLLKLTDHPEVNNIQHVGKLIYTYRF